MLVKVVNDICLKVVDDPEHQGKYTGWFILCPNSVRKDVTFAFSIRIGETMRNRHPFGGKDLGQ